VYEVIELIKGQLVNDILSVSSKYKDQPERLKIQVNGMLSEYQVDKKIVFDLNKSDIEQKIDFYLAAKKVERLSPNTINSYRTELSLFVKQIHKNANDIDSDDIRSYLAKLNTAKISTLGKKLWVLKSFFTWMFNEKIIDNNPTLNIKQPKTERKMPKIFSIEELEMMRESCHTVRQRAMLELFYATGCRLSEIQQLNVQDIDWHDYSIVVFGKGSKEREVYFSFKAAYHLKKYLNMRHDSCTALFVTERNPHHRISNRGIEREINIIGKNANLDRKISCHWMRRSMATHALNNGCDLASMQEILGHSNPETTLLYCRVTEKRKHEQYNKYAIQ
jgi:integrase/recombinase XerD